MMTGVGVEGKRARSTGFQLGGIRVKMVNNGANGGRGLSFARAWRFGDMRRVGRGLLGV